MTPIVANAAVNPSDAAFATPTSGAALIWRRFRQERLGMVALVGLAFIVLGCFVGEPLLAHVLGHSDEAFFPGSVDVSLRAAPPWSWIPNQPSGLPAHKGDTLFILGADGPLGRDELLRLLSGGQLSLEVAAIASGLALVVGVTLGMIAGWFGGIVDAVIARLTELTMALPILLLVVAIGQTVADRLESVTVFGVLEPGVFALGIVIGCFSWFYPARVVRTLAQSLREQEFVEAARSTGASEARILRSHVLPHLAGPVIVWGTLVASGVIVLEAALSILNFGVKLGTASWGNLLSDAWGSLLVFNPNSAAPQYSRSGWLMLWPSLALFLTVLCLALIGDALRNALDPRGEG